MRLTFSLVAQSDHRLRDPLPPASGSCDSCVRKGLLTAKPSIDQLVDELHVGLEVYHQFDCVMIESGKTGVPYIVGQIDTFDDMKGTFEVRIFGRYTELGRGGFQDEVSGTKTSRLTIASVVLDRPISALCNR
jgi:hypothetical protein